MSWTAACNHLYAARAAALATLLLRLLPTLRLECWSRTSKATPTSKLKNPKLAPKRGCIEPHREQAFSKGVIGIPIAKVKVGAITRRTQRQWPRRFNVEMDLWRGFQAINKKVRAFAYAPEG